MSATYLIDGYNLLHAMGLIRGRAGPNGLEKARGQLLGLLRGSLAEEVSAVTVVFDGAGAAPGKVAEQRDGLHVLFAQGKEEADDVIERLIRQSSAPKSLHVISDDHRVQKATRRRGATVRGCDDFLNWLKKHREGKRKQEVEQPEKKEQLTERDVERWVAEFGDLERDPSLKKAFESFDFESED